MPSDMRNMKVKTRLPVPSIATSGRWSRRADGEWGFDFDDDAPITKNAGDDEANAAALSAAAASGQLRSVESEDEDDEENSNNKTLHPENANINVQLQPAKRPEDISTTTATSNAPAATTPTKSSSTPVAACDASVRLAPLHLVLRMRDEKKELQDIKFEFLPNKDTVDEISHELVNAKLIDAIDMIAVSANLNKLLDNNSLSPITFPLVII